MGVGVDEAEVDVVPDGPVEVRVEAVVVTLVQV